MQKDFFRYEMRINLGEGARFMESILIEMTSFGSVVITLFGAAFCLMQTRHSRVSQCFAAFLIAIAVNNLPGALAQVLSTLPNTYTSLAECITWPSSFLLAPLFWIYVYVLTSSEQELPKRLARHAVLPAASCVVAILILVSPPAIRDSLFSSEPQLNSGWAITLAAAIVVLQFAVLAQIALYLVLILRRLLKFRIKLRDFYSSTEKHELRWIYVIGFLSIVFWLTTTLILVVLLGFDETSTFFANISSVAGFVLVSALTLWGIRQRPPLMPDPDNDPAPSKAQASPKYEKSALSAEASERLSRKLRNAMEKDHLHRDANLSLWSLARHIGASSNYISQTLNEVIGESFFDFVNSYRIAEAQTLLTTTDESVLNITYDVGFNARSSFYNAFKRHTGQTPTNYRKKKSSRDGMDDMSRKSGDS